MKPRAQRREREQIGEPAPRECGVASARASEQREQCALLVRRESGGLLGGLWELPGGDLEPGEKPADAARRALRAKLGLEVASLSRAGQVRHLFTHRDLTLHVLRGEALPGRVRREGIAEHRWLVADRVAELASATVTRKALALLDAQSPSAAASA